MAVPMLCLDPAGEIDFCKAAFDAVELSRRLEENGGVVQATLGIGEILIMVHSETNTSRAARRNWTAARPS